ncbi:MAG: methylmalonyl-CoA mutase family protein [Bdellovibrionales bacterium]|nr:methylmalonyl-CoA mutase family protein [Bdellovibrionales bacterium]
MSWKNPIRVVTAASLFDGHDAAINVIRRVLQDMGAEVIHLGHNRSVQEVAEAVLQEGAQGVCVSSYQGGHMEYFKYLKDLLDEAGAGYVKIFGGGGGVIVHEEKRELENYGIAQIFHPDDGRRLGLEGMIRMIMEACDFNLTEAAAKLQVDKKSVANAVLPMTALGVALTGLENGKPSTVADKALAAFARKSGKPLVLGITGTGGAGKSSLIDELLVRFKNQFPKSRIGVVCVDPSKRRTGGALLGDRIRMNALARPGTFMRSLASRNSGSEIALALPGILDFLKGYEFDLLIAESSGIGQASSRILEVSDLSLYVMTSEFGAQSQLEKIDMIDYADLVSINKADRRGSLDAHRDVQKQYRRARKIFDHTVPVPVFLTQASNFNDNGVNQLFVALTETLVAKGAPGFSLSAAQKASLIGSEKQTVVPPERQNYLAEIVSTVRQYKADVKDKAGVASNLGALAQVERLAGGRLPAELASKREEFRKRFSDDEWAELSSFDRLHEEYSQNELVYEVRGREIRQALVRQSLCGLNIPRVAVPSYADWGDRYRYLKLENVPGAFPYTAGVFPLKRTEEDPTRQFAGEGPPERTNRRFHFLSKGEPAKRLSTAFDSVTLYGEDPDLRPDIYGKVGESGVSIASLEDMKKLYDGFDLCDPSTSVSMTINGPAPMILAFFLNTAVDQQLAKKERELGRKLTAAESDEVRKWTLSTVRGTVQADILKEDQGQNTCIFSIDFALKMMADIQQFFTENSVRNFYSVSISGYHIAEAGANPITQLALTLSNAFTYIEYYLSRGLKVDEFAPNLSFFFSNGLDPEYTVIGRVARRIWSIALRDKYRANERSQKLKYHIQTSGRSLHAQEIAFNDIRTTLQALIAIFDQCNSLHTNAYDEAITTPTEESVRRAKAIQLIINKEFGMAKNENPLQGSFFTEWLTEAVEEAVLEEFLRINERGGVLGAMETQYQRSRIQDESLHYETLKHNGSLPIVGVNTFVDPQTLDPAYVPPKIEMARATLAEKKQQLDNVHAYQARLKTEAESELEKLKAAAVQNKNIFAALMNAARVCSLGQMTTALYEVGGKYRRNI